MECQQHSVYLFEQPVERVKKVKVNYCNKACLQPSTKIQDFLFHFFKFVNLLQLLKDS